MKRLLLMLFCIASLDVCAQKAQTQDGSYTYFFESHVSLKQAKEYAEKMAQQDAIKKAFGTLISGESNISVNTTGGAAQMEYFRFDQSILKGEWVGNVDEPVFTEPKYDAESELMFITCNVKGRVRPIGNAAPEFEWHLMRNHLDKRSEVMDGKFLKEDTLYMTFKAPTHGYLAVFIIDERGKAQCLLPHTDQPEGIYQIQRNKTYTFFNTDNEDGMKWSKTPVVLFTDREQEENYVYIIFSPNEFHVGKKLEASSDDRKYMDANGRPRALPLEMSKEDFWKWLSKCMNKDENMQRVIKAITIND